MCGPGKKRNHEGTHKKAAHDTKKGVSTQNPYVQNNRVKEHRKKLPGNG